MEQRQIRAVYDADTVTVYQAYSAAIAGPALRAGRFVDPFRRERMTWIKPSFLWMMYRAGWGTKPGQEHVLAVRIRRAGFDWALAHACLSHYDREVHADRADWSRQLKASPVRVQWDPERSVTLAPLPYRSLQMGLSGEAVDRYVDEWIVELTDVTHLGRDVRAGAHERLPAERPYPMPPAAAERLS